MLMLIAAQLTIDKSWNQHSWGSPTVGQMEKIWHVYTMEKHSAFKRSKIMPCVGN
jgi:hypothetical protein